MKGENITAGIIYPRPLCCTVCNGTDHPVNLCPMQDARSYLGVTAETVGPLLELSRKVLNPRGKKSSRDGSRTKAEADGKGKGKGKDDRKGGDRRRVHSDYIIGRGSTKILK
ncbi:hypothetical protein K438DRAFT_1763187 [Mycena galopus ATCC 62051]|nr:hypothetical protein K438DRAFT_1763187 [Mycena galopus ATCC 62051]